jgi:tRNA pseudouridine55 synthase
MYSAKKINGKKLYELARKNIKIERKPQSIKIFYIKIKKYIWPKLQLEIHCSSGTYIRTIANDLGKELDCGAYLEELRRTAIGNYTVKRAKKVKEIAQNTWKKYLFNI